jgi:DNA-binding response OmpR family regulator
VADSPSLRTLAMHILTVDDSASIRKPIMRRIGHAGTTDTGFAGSRDAIESRTFDLILVDAGEGNLEKPFTLETIQSSIGPLLK